MRTIYAFTDVHGHYDIARTAFDFILAIDPNARIIGLGDYIDRGPNSPDLVEYLIENNIECLKGNHEAMMIDAHDVGYYSGAGAYRFWRNNGGFETELSYQNQGKHHLINKHVDWMRSLPTMIETDANIFVHAGLNPQKPMNEQTDEERMWIRDRFLFSNHDFGKHVVHGHTPREEVELLPNRTNLDVGTPFVRNMAVGIFTETTKGPIGMIKIKSIEDHTKFSITTEAFSIKSKIEMVVNNNYR